MLLAIDLGLRTGFALYDEHGRLVRYWSSHFPNKAQLRRCTYKILKDIQDLRVVVVEGGGDLELPWASSAEKLNLHYIRLSAERWRQCFFYKRNRCGTKKSKESADKAARQVIDWFGAKKPTSLRHDAAEAIMIGLWAVYELKWLEELPPFIQ